nr:fumarylacetoacetate hydrolase family protein [Modestobacter excelsi]
MELAPRDPRGSHCVDSDPGGELDRQLPHEAAHRALAGDVLGSGTCGNGGCLGELWGRRGELSTPPLQPGDVVEMTVEGIGTIRNRVVAGLELPPVRPARPRPRTRNRAC